MPPNKAHPRALRRWLENLVENAPRYGNRAQISLEDNAEWLRIAMRDNGAGIPAQDLERVLEPDFRLEPSRNRDHGGTGLGLATVRKIARRHGGDSRLRNATDGNGLIASCRAFGPGMPVSPQLNTASRP